MEFLATFQKEWPIISQAPWSIVTIALFCAVTGWAVGRFLSNERINNLESRNKLQADQIVDYKEKLSGASPDQAKARLESLEAKIAELLPRRLTADQKTLIQTNMSNSLGTIAITIDMAAGEAKALAEDFASAFLDSGWRIIRPMVMGLGQHPPSGLALQVDNPFKLTPTQVSVKNLLEKLSIPYNIHGGLMHATQPPPGLAYMGEADPEVGLLFTTKLQ